MISYANMSRLLDRKVLIPAPPNYIQGTIIGICTGNTGRPEVAIECDGDRVVRFAPLEGATLLPATAPMRKTKRYGAWSDPFALDGLPAKD